MLFHNNIIRLFSVLLCVALFVQALPPSEKPKDEHVSAHPEPQTDTTTSVPTTPVPANKTTVAPITTVAPNATTNIPTTPPTPATTTTSPTTTPVTPPTTPPSTTTNKSNTTTNAPVTSPATTVTAAPDVTTTHQPPGPTPNPGKHDFSGWSFLLGVVATVCIIGLSMGSYKFYKIKTDRSYRTL